MSAETMIIEKTVQGIRISDICNGQYITKHYIGYTKKDAVALFKKHLKG